jgi:uncharacterized membrane protein
MTTLTRDRDLDRWRWFLLVAAVYDIALGVAFFFFYEPIFKAIDMPLPSHVSYVHLSAVFVAIQGLSYLLAWLDPLANVGIVKVGVAYKAAYSALAAYYVAVGQIPSMFFAWFGLFDFVFLIGFVLFIRWAGRRTAAA